MNQPDPFFGRDTRWFRDEQYRDSTNLTPRWLLHEGHASTVELRIDAGNTDSQRAAAAAGFPPAGTIRSHVPATGETYNDLRFIMRQHGGHR